MHVSVQWHDEIDDAHVYEMKCNNVGAKHLGCYNLHQQGGQEDLHTLSLEEEKE